MRFSLPRGSLEYDFLGFSSLSLSLLSRVLPLFCRCLAFPKDCLAASFLAVSSPSAFSQQRTATYLPRLPALGYGAFSAFLTLSRLSSAQILPTFFHAGPVLGVSPSGPYFACRAFRPLGRHTLLWFTPPAATILTLLRSKSLGIDPGRSSDQS